MLRIRTVHTLFSRLYDIYVISVNSRWKGNVERPERERDNERNAKTDEDKSIKKLICFFSNMS